MNNPFSSYRSLFPVLSEYVHLASCSQGAIAQPVSQAIEDYHNQLLSSGTNWKQATLKLEATREKFAKLINAEPDEIAILTSVSDALLAVATSLPYHPSKNEIILTDMDFPTVGHVWYAQEKYGVTVSLMRSLDGVLPLEQYEKDVTERTLLTCMSHASYNNGTTQNLKDIADIVHKKGSLLFVDASQSAGHIPIDVKEMNIDMLSTVTRKYMLGIPGVAFLYMKKDLAEQVKPRHTGWFGQESETKFNIFHSTYAPGARRFETGTPSFISVYAAHAALNLLLDVGVSPIHSYLKELSSFTKEFGLQSGLQINRPFDTEITSGITSFYMANASEIEQRLKEKNILVSATNDVIRVAPHFYNTKEEVAYAITELSKFAK
ncbi:aminotransferase class V-fold PLP-dependent enzyme [Priestia megaterium]|uniref:aminotransferase class V-fold PLP-dependent enzyme n=1 Tax=Priestia megaterium TaxID=1404 RepID=UPI001C211AB5|nr:aminotransferase class V-fold PLP-dependent enzyme [Priestia megaterium]MBU8589236.1 aminotransferase class V-fold PLP-dependent enzyme [Priestia megaterium]